MNYEREPIPRIIDSIRSNRDRLIVSSVAALSVALFDGGNKISEAVASPIPVGNGVSNLAGSMSGESGNSMTPAFADKSIDSPIANAAYSSQDAKLCNEVFGKNSVCEWGLDKAETRSLPGTIRGRWNVCDSWKKSRRYDRDIRCDLSKSESSTVKASITGTRELGWGTLSAAVGYDLTKTTSITVGQTVHAPKGTSGEIIYRYVYDKRREVTQELKECIALLGYGQYKCYFADRPNPKAIRKLETGKYSHVDWGTRRTK